MLQNIRSIFATSGNSFDELEVTLISAVEDFMFPGDHFSTSGVLAVFWTMKFSPRIGAHISELILRTHRQPS